MRALLCAEVLALLTDLRDLVQRVEETNHCVSMLCFQYGESRFHLCLPIETVNILSLKGILIPMMHRIGL